MVFITGCFDRFSCFFFFSIQAEMLALHKQGVPVHFLRGTTDVILTRGTLGLSLVGVGYFGYVMYRMAYGLK